MKARALLIGLKICQHMDLMKMWIGKGCIKNVPPLAENRTWLTIKSQSTWQNRSA